MSRSFAEPVYGRASTCPRMDFRLVVQCTEKGQWKNNAGLDRLTRGSPLPSSLWWRVRFWPRWCLEAPRVHLPWWNRVERLRCCHCTPKEQFLHWVYPAIFHGLEVEGFNSSPPQIRKELKSNCLALDFKCFTVAVSAQEDSVPRGGREGRRGFRLRVIQFFLHIQWRHLMEVEGSIPFLFSNQALVVTGWLFSIALPCLRVVVFDWMTSRHHQWRHRCVS